MKKFLMGIIIGLLCLAPISQVKAEDPLNAKQQAWLRKHGTLRVGMSSYYPPFVFVDALGEPQGMAIDFWRLFSSKLQFWIQFYPDLFQNQFDGVKTGKYDSIVGVFPLAERQKFFDFTRPYTIIRTYIYVKPQYAHLKNLSDIKELKVGVVSGDSSQVVARKAGLNLISSPTYREAIFRVADGDADALILDELVVAYFVKKYNLQNKVVKIGEPVDVGKMTLPVRKGNTVLLDILNKGVDMVSKEEWREIEEKWLGQK
jgi:ABC-type amino acid transport substrate-binding protein